MIGKKLGNRYEIIEQIGAGGMATVYKPEAGWAASPSRAKPTTSGASKASCCGPWASSLRAAMSRGSSVTACGV